MVKEVKDARALVPVAGSLIAKSGGWEVPALIDASGKNILRLTLDWLGVTIPNDNTRRAYMLALSKFCDAMEENEFEKVQQITPRDVAGYIAGMKAAGRATATQKQHLAALRVWFDFLVSHGALRVNPALSVKTDRQSITKGKTPILSTDEAGELLRSIPCDSIVGLRDRAFIGVMVFTFARVSAVCGLAVGDMFHQNRRLWLRLHEKGGKVHDMPCHHTLENYLNVYIEASSITSSTDPLFQSIDKYSRALSGKRFNRHDAWEMVQRRAKAAGIKTEVCNHTFRGTGITTYLENGGTLENAQHMAAHASTRTTQLYDRRSDAVTLDEVVKINIKG